MILSHRQRFVLLAPWKTASSTARLRLNTYNESPYSGFYDYNPYLQRVVHQHITYAEFMALPEGKLSYFVAAFVRNPYDRVYSAFLQLQRDLQQQPSAAFPNGWVKALVMRQLAENFAQLAAGEFDFDKWFALVEDHQVYEIGRNSSFPLHPAHYWTGIGGKREVNFVGKVERFEQDFDTLCQQIGVDRIGRANENVTGQLSEPDGPLPYRHLDKMSPASISKVNALFDLDFELFGYAKVRR
jgi:hypothetical protein